MKKFAIAIFLLGALTSVVKAQDGFVKTPTGNLVKNITNKAGNKIKLDDVVTFELIQKTEKDSLLSSTYVTGQPYRARITPSRSPADLLDVFPLLTVHDSAYVKVPTDSIFKGHDAERPPFFPKGSSIICVIKIDRIQPLDDVIKEQNKLVDSLTVAEKVGREKYIADNKLVLKTTATGLKYVITKPSLKAKPLAGDTISVAYVGKGLDGKIFDTSIAEEAKAGGVYQDGRPYVPYEFVVGKGNVIPGWDEGLLLLGLGAKAKFVIPSNLAYGAQGQGQIQPFSTLVFDVEITSIKPIKHAAPPVKAAPKKAPVKKHTTVKKKS